MAQYMVQIALPEYKDEYFIKLIPEQRDHADSLMAQGIISNYCLSMDKNILWIVFNLKNETKVIKTLEAFPISDFMEYEITELAFNNAAAFVFPNLSLN